MAKFVGIKNNRICIISDINFVNDNYQIIQLSSELEKVANNDLIVNYKVKDGYIVSKNNPVNAANLKVAFITNWASKCGIATYGESLFPEITKHIGNFKLFIEENDNLTHNINDFGDGYADVSVCWKRGENFSKLIEEINAYNPDIVLINHEWGIFPNSRYWLSLMTQLSNYRVIVVMHSVFPNHYDKTIVEASINEIVVHLDGAKKALTDKGVAGKIEVIPHGCYPIVNQNKLWNFYRSNYTFIQVGFGLKYKGFEDCIKATAILKEKYNDVFFTAVFSETPFGMVEHELYYRELIKLINDLGLQDNVGIIRGFQSDLVIDSYFRTNQAAVFPYKSNKEHEVFGATGAGRMAMAKGIPVISSSIPHFSDLPTIKADGEVEIAEKLDMLFSDWKKKVKQVELQNKFIENNSWENVALRYIKLFENK